MTTGGRLAHAPVGSSTPRFPIRVRAATTVGAIGLGAALGAAVAAGQTLLVLAAIVALGALAIVLVRPEALLIGWFAAILVDGRSLTYTKVGPLYVTEPLLALLVLGVLAGILVQISVRPEVMQPRGRAVRFVLALVLVMLIPALAGLGLETSSANYATGRNLLLVLYPLFALIIVCVTDLRNSYRYWFVIALAAPAVALLVMASGNAGDEGGTSTGAIRFAGYTFALAFGIAPIVAIAAAREHLIRPLVGAALTIPFLFGLVFVNHRSAWLAFIAAAVILFSTRVSPAVVVGSLAVVSVGFVLLTSPLTGSSTLGKEVARAKSVTSTDDPNAQFRLLFWEAAMARSLRSPLIGNGFDRFPENIVPPNSGPPDPFPSPHNSFVSIAYRTGFIPFLIVMVMLLDLVRRGYRASKERPTSRDRAICAALTAIVVYAGVTSAFNVFLEAPYAGPLFWTCVGLLAYAVFADPFHNGDAAQRDA